MPTATTAVLKVEVIKKTADVLHFAALLEKKVLNIFYDGLKWNQQLAAYNQTVLTETVCAYSI